MADLVKLNKVQIQAFNNSLNTLLSVKGVDNITLAMAKLNTADTIREKTLLPMCRLYYVVKSKDLYKQADYKNFEIWAQKVRKIGRSTAFNYAKCGEFVTEDGFETIFKDKETQVDFDYSALLMLVTLCTRKNDKGKIDTQATTEYIENAIKSGLIVVGMTSDQIKATLCPKKTKKGGEIKIDETKLEITDETKLETTDETETEKQVDPLAVARKSALYKQYEQAFAKLVLKALNEDNPNILAEIFKD